MTGKKYFEALGEKSAKNGLFTLTAHGPKDGSIKLKTTIAQMR